MQQFQLSLATKDGKRTIKFANNTEDFVEVVFAIDDKEAKEGKPFNKAVRGYAYSPKLEKMVTKTKDGQPLPFKAAGHGNVKAYVYRGNGRNMQEKQNLEVPTFVRRQLTQKVHFERTSDEPLEVLQCDY